MVQDDVCTRGAGRSVIKHTCFLMEFCHQFTGGIFIVSTNCLFKLIVILRNRIGELIEPKVVAPIIPIRFNIRGIQEAGSSGKAKINRAGKMSNYVGRCFGKSYPFLGSSDLKCKITNW